VTGPVLALFAASSAATAEAEEFLRVCAGVAACGDGLLLLEAGPGRGALASDEVSEAAVRTLEALEGSGVSPRPADARGLRGSLRAARAVLRLADAGRAGTPALLVVTDAWLDEARRTDDQVFEAVMAAGQVLRARS
jgi:hypothetical protein